MKYSTEDYNEAKRLYIQEGMSPRKISQDFNGHPAWQTIENWRKKKDVLGKTWSDLRDDFRDNQYSAISPQKLASAILEKISKALEDYEGGSKSADELVKLSKLMERLVDKKLQIHTMFDMMTDYIKFLQKNYPKLMEKQIGKEILASVRDFKNNLRSRLNV